MDTLLAIAESARDIMTTKTPTLPLTPRELQVLALLVDAKHDHEIATILDISQHTAKFHVNSIIVKTKQHTRLGAVMHCLRNNIITLMPDMLNDTTIDKSVNSKEENDNMKTNLLEDIMESVNKLDYVKYGLEECDKEIKETLNVYFPT